MDAADLQLREYRRQLSRVLLGGFQLYRQLLVLLHHGAYNKHLPSLLHLFADKAVEPCPVALVYGEGVHLLPSRRQLVNDGKIQIAVDDQCQGPGDRGGGHDQHMGLDSLPGEGRSLVYPETVLLIRHHQGQPVVFHIVADQGVGAHDQVQLPLLQLGLDLPFLFCAHGAGQLSHPQPKGGQHVCQRVEVLLRQNFRRGHEGAGAVIFGAEPDQRRRHQGLAAAHISLHQPVHHRTGSHICRGLAHRPPLSPGGGKGQTAPEFLHVKRFQPDAIVQAPLPVHPPQGAGQDEQLLKNQPPPGQLQSLKVGGEVNVLVGVAGLSQLAVLPHRIRQNVRQQLQTTVQPLAHRLLDAPLVQPGAQPVHRDDPPGDLPGPVLRLIYRVRHGAPPAPKFYPPKKVVALSPVQIILGVGLIEKSYVN